MGLFDKFKKPAQPERLHFAGLLFCPEHDRSLFWLAGCDDMCPWDDIDLST